MGTIGTTNEVYRCQLCPGFIRCVDVIYVTDTGRETLRGKCQECLAVHTYWRQKWHDGKVYVQCINFRAAVKRKGKRETPNRKLPRA